MTSCSSSVSVQRSSKTEDQRSKSCETACSSNSSCFFQKRKPMNPLMYPLRPSYTRSSGNTVRQRVLSAKLLKVRSLQNQLNDANFHLSEIAKENQTLKNLQKRQDKALSKYEGMNEDLPRLMHAHGEQTRVLTEKNKALRRTVREVTEVLKTRDEELARAQDKLTHLEKLNRDKHLTDREKLMDQMEDLKLKLEKSDEQVAFLNRKLMLESKAFKQRLNAETAKHKQCQKQLSQALMEVERLTGLLETKENTAQPRKQRFNRLGNRQSVSMITLLAQDKLTASNESETKSAVTDVKLEPIKCSKSDENAPKKCNGVLDAPSENIKCRLSSNSAHSRDSGDSSTMNDVKEHSSGSDISLDLVENVTGSTEEETRRLTSSGSGDADRKMTKNRPQSSVKLEKLSTHLESVIQKSIERGNEQFDSNLGELCSDVASNVRVLNERLEAQQASLKISTDDTRTIFEAFKKTKKLESKLRKSLMNSDDDLVNEIISEELKFQIQANDEKGTDTNGNVRKAEPRVTSEDKKKLLATLKAIDNGENLDSLDNSPARRQQKRIFSNVYSVE